MLTLLFFSWKLVHYYWFLTKSLASLWLFHFKHEVNCSDNYNCLIDKPLWHLFILNLNLFSKFWVEVNNCLDFKLVSWISNLCLPAICSWSIKYMPSWVPNTRLDEPDSVSWTIWYNKLLRVAQHIWHTLDQMCILGPILVSRTFNSFMETNHKHFGWCAPVAVGSICCFRTHNDSVILIVLLSFCFCFCFCFFFF